MLEPNAPRHALLEVAALLQDGQLLAGPRLAPEVGDEKHGPSPPPINCKDSLAITTAL